jgi:invasion protein IalB
MRQHLLAAITIFGDHGRRSWLSGGLIRDNQLIRQQIKDFPMARAILKLTLTFALFLSLVTAPVLAQQAPPVQQQPVQINKPAVQKKRPIVQKKQAVPAATPAPEPAPPAPDDTSGEDVPAMDNAQTPPPPAVPPQQQAQQKVPQPPKQLVGTTTGWVRVCQKMKDNEKEGCSIKEDVVAENGAFLASIAIQEVTGEQRRQLIVTTPLGMALQAGLLLRIDSEKVLPAKFGTCLVNGCFAGLDVTMDMINGMKKGKNAFITVRNIQGAALDLTVPLTTFAKAYDGPAMDVQALQESQKKLQDELLKRAEKAREELLKQQGGTPAPPAAPKTGN